MRMCKTEARVRFSRDRTEAKIERRKGGEKLYISNGICFLTSPGPASLCANRCLGGAEAAGEQGKYSQSCVTASTLQLIGPSHMYTV